ncbi:MAG: hypothetical protein LBG88_02580, partial [Christensenellaceae bacterium]|nr:hypothetical protein [Christensenellaceae bacterium]
FAYICNLINHAQTNSWENANAMYLTRAPMPSVPTWLFLLLCYVAGAGIGLALIFLKDRLRKSQ